VVGERFVCSVWNNGGSGWGAKVLGGVETRFRYFRPGTSPVFVELDDIAHPFNINKKSFWTPTCGELIGKPFDAWRRAHNLPRSAHFKMEVVEPFRRFRAVSPTGNSD
jgi:hypothetical protein